MTVTTFKTSVMSRLGLLRPTLFSVALCVFSGVFYSTSHAETLSPPTLGEETKGKPAIAEPIAVSAEEQAAQNKANEVVETVSPFGKSTITEHKRESGQVYLIEIDNSLSGKQYLYENDSDGQIGSSVEDNESIKEIPKWKLGSW